MYDGVLFRSAKFMNEGDKEKEYQWAIVLGRVVKDPDIQHYNKTKTSFTVAYHTKKYLNVAIWGDTDVSRVAATLEKGDVVLCIGTITYAPYTIRSGEHKGEKKIWSDLNPQLILPMSYVHGLIEMFASEKLRALLDSEASDTMESLGDHTDEYAVEGYDGGAEYEDDYEISI